MTHENAPWLTEQRLPNGWRETALYTVADVRFSSVDKLAQTSEQPIRLCNYIDVYKNDYITGDLEFMEASATQPEIDRFGLKVGDIIITKDSETPNDIGVPAVVDYAAPDLVCGYHLGLIRPNQSNVDSTFLAKQLAHHCIAKYFGRQANGLTRYGLPLNAVMNAPLLLPERGEQEAIGALLRLVDEAIVMTEAVIAKLKQVRAGLVHDLLTRGLDEQGQLRDPISHPEQFQASPMGRIPREWLLFTVADVGDTVAGGTPARATQSFWGGDVPWITPTDMTSLKGNYISGGTDFITNEGLSNSAAALLPKGAVVVTTRATLGLAAVASRPLATNQGFKNVIPPTGWDSLYLCHVFRSLTPEMIRRASGTTFLEISATEFRRLCFAAPRPRSGEQERIARCAAAADSNVSVVQDECHKLKSLKSGLMTDLLSGRVRVPENTEVILP